MRHALLIASIVLLVLLTALPGHADSRVALVIGNSAYRNVAVLPNTQNDANEALDKLYLSVVGEPTSRRTMRCQQCGRRIRCRAADNVVTAIPAVGVIPGSPLMETLPPQNRSRHVKSKRQISNSQTAAQGKQIEIAGGRLMPEFLRRQITIHPHF
jgi:hypothetical protein